MNERWALMRALFDDLRDPLVIVAPLRDERGAVVDWSYREVNDLAVAVVGLPRQEIIGKTIGQVAPEALVQTNLGLSRVLETGEPWRGDIPYGGRDFVATFFRVDEGSVGMTAIDITERQRSQERLTSEHASLTRLHELSARLVSQAALPTLLQAVVDAAVDLAGASHGMLQFHDAPAQTSRIVAHHALPQPFVDHFAAMREEALECGERTVVLDLWESPLFDAPETMAVVKEAGVRAMQSTPLVARNGSLLGVVSTYWRTSHVPEEGTLRMLDLLARHASDLIEHRQREEALRESDRRKDEFLAVLSHELRNPLGPIRHSLVLLDHVAPDSEQARRARETLHRQTKHLARLVDELLDITRLSRGKIELRREVLNLGEVARQACEDAGFAFRDRQIALHFDAPPEPLWVEGDPNRLAQVVGNLLHNAAKFTERRGHAALRLAGRDGYADVRIRDNGIGIAADQLQLIFEPFVQVASGLSRSRGGLGIGLTLVRKLVELHGGVVSASSGGMGHGAEFVVKLPLAAAPPTARLEPALRPPDVQRTVVIIEDNEEAAQSLAEVLALAGHRVSIAIDGRSGLALVRRVRPQVVLCDIGLPDIDGYEIARTLRADTSLPGLRLVAVSGYDQPEDRERASQAGFDAHLAKPPNIEEILALLQSAN